MKFIITSFLLLVLAVITISAFTITEITAPPTGFTTVTSDQVNVSGGINGSTASSLYTRYGPISETNLSNNMVNVSILQKNTSTGSYKILDTSVMNVSNFTRMSWNLTVTVDEGYNWIRLNFTNVTTSQGGVLGVQTDERIINLDSNLYMLNIGGLDKINFTLDDGHIEIAGNLTIRANVTGQGQFCCFTSAGMLYASTNECDGS